MTALVAAGRTGAGVVAGEMKKVPAFLRRDFLVAWSYRMAFLSDAATLTVQALMFYFVGKLVDPSQLPTFGGSPTTYMEFAAIGIALGAFMHLALGRVALGLRTEQMTGTLEALLMTPTSPATIQIGTVVYDLLYIPLRTILFLVVIAAAFGLDFDAGGLAPAAVVLLAFIPFVWGLGIVNAAMIVTFRRGSGVAGLGVSLLTLFSGAYFPLTVLPQWAEDAARFNPIALAVDGMREPLLGGTGWNGIGVAVAVLLPLSVVSLALAALAWRLALRREQRRGSLALY